jgi:hypothetical protein
MSVLKVLVTLWRNYEISVVDEHEELVLECVGFPEAWNARRIDQTAGPDPAPSKARNDQTRPIRSVCYSLCPSRSPGLEIIQDSMLKEGREK